MTRAQHPIEVESYRILRSRVDTAVLPPVTRAVTERVIHTSADLDYASDLVCDEEALRVGQRALATGAPLVVDVRMLAAGITSRQCVAVSGRAGPGAYAGAGVDPVRGGDPRGRC